MKQADNVPRPRWLLILMFSIASACSFAGCGLHSYPSPVPGGIKNEITKLVGGEEYAQAAHMVREANIENEVLAALIANDRQYFGVRGFGIRVPGVENEPGRAEWASRECFMMPATSDVFSGDDRSAWNWAAGDFAEKYNRALEHRLELMGDRIPTTLPVATVAGQVMKLIFSGQTGAAEDLLDKLDVEAQVTAALAQKNERYLGVLTDGSDLPGLPLDPSTAEWIQAENAAYILPGTSDAQQAGPETEWQAAATRLAKAYNAALYQRLRAPGGKSETAPTPAKTEPAVP